MKYIIILLLITIQLKAQTFKFTDSSVMYEEENVPSVNVVVEPSVDNIKDKFEDWMNDQYDVDLDGRTLLFFDKDILKAEGTVVPQISPQKIDMLVKVDENAAGKTSFNVFASHGYDNWITRENHPAEFSAMRNIVYEFMRDYLPNYYQNKIKNSQEDLKDLKDDKKELADDLDDNQNDIEKLKQENKELMQKMKENQEKIYSEEQRLRMKKNNLKKVKKNINNTKIK